tara:strand:+ start:123 stop:257 length:135 start_codon:yes stop_codon:yes gene_type:complete
VEVVPVPLIEAAEEVQVVLEQFKIYLQAVEEVQLLSRLVPVVLQ